MRPYNTTHKQITKNNHKQKNCLTKSNLQKNKILASTIQFSHNTHTPHTNHQTAACPQHAATCKQEQQHVSSQTPNSAPTTNQHKKGKHKRLKSSHARADHPVSYTHLRAHETN